VLKVKVKVKGHVIRALSWILGMSYSVIDGLVLNLKSHFQDGGHDGIPGLVPSRDGITHATCVRSAGLTAAGWQRVISS